MSPSLTPITGTGEVKYVGKNIATTNIFGYPDTVASNPRKKKFTMNPRSHLAKISSPLDMDMILFHVSLLQLDNDEIVKILTLISPPSLSPYP